MTSLTQLGPPNFEQKPLRCQILVFNLDIFTLLTKNIVEKYCTSLLLAHNSEVTAQFFLVW